MKDTTSVSETKIEYCLYARKSSEADERQALSIDSQITEMTRIAKKEGIAIVETIKESKSAKASGVRKGYQKLLEGIEEGRFNAILTWAPDRLSRNAGDLGGLVDLMDKGLLQKIRSHGQSFTNTPDEKFLLMILCSQAKLENDNRAKNVKRGLRTKCEMGIRPGSVPLGYKLIRSENFREASKTKIDEERAPYIKKIFEYIAQNGMSGKQAWEYVTDEGLRTKKGKEITPSMAYRIIREPFYYGEFEYPKGSGNWYKGSHKPIISKELFKKVQEEIKVVSKGKWGRKQFYFSKLLKCGGCGSSICGVEHINRHGKLYTYYRCTKSGKNFRCKEKYIREEKLIKRLSEIIDQIKDQHVRLNRRITQDLERLNRLRKGLAGLTVLDYVQEILQYGDKQEKSDILRCLENKLSLKSGVITCSETE